MKKKKLLFGFFTENMSYPASILSSLAIGKKWDADLVYFADSETKGEIKEKINGSKPDLLALTFKTFERKKAFQVAKIAKQKRIKVVGGGIHSTACPEDLITSGYFDGIVVGDGMGVFGDILDSYTALNGQIIKGKKHNDISVYTNRYFSESQKQRILNSKTFEILTSLGCSYNCHFCSNTRDFMKFPIEDVVDEIVEAKINSDIERIIINDDTFTFNQDRVKKFREFIEKHGFTFSYTLQARANCFNNVIASELVALGAEDVGFGIETASPKLLRFLNKQIEVEDAYRAAEICKRHGLAFKTNFLFGLPTQDKEDYEATFNFVKEVKPDVVFLYHFVPFPGSFLFNYCLENNYMPDEFSFDNYFYIDKVRADYKGLRENAGILKNIDYEMASEYMNKIIEFDNERKNKTIFNITSMADESKWILFGTADYFYRVLEKISLRKWNNCLGYYDYNEDAFKQRRYFFTIPRYRWQDIEQKPETVVITTHKGRSFNNLISPLLKNKFDFNGKILSVSTYGQNLIE